MSDEKAASLAVAVRLAMRAYVIEQYDRTPTQNELDEMLMWWSRVMRKFYERR